MRFTIFFLLTFCLYNVLNAQVTANTTHIPVEHIDVEVDSSGNIFIIGSFRNQIDLDFNPKSELIIKGKGSDDVFLAKYDSNLQIQWAKGFVGVSGDDYSGLAFTDDGGIIFSGTFQQQIDLDPGTGVYEFTTGFDLDAFICKLDSNGDFVWAKQIKGNSNELISKPIRSKSGHFYFTGSFASPLTLEIDTGTVVLNDLYGRGVFVMRMNPNGIIDWVDHISSYNGVTATSFDTDSKDNVYVTGTYSHVLYFNTFQNSIASPNIQSDVYLCKIDSSGKLIWTNEIAGNNHDYSSNVLVDSKDQVYCSGRFDGKVDFDNSDAKKELTSIITAIYLSKFDSNGKVIWAHKLEAPGDYEQAYDLVEDQNGIIITTGRFRDSCIASTPDYVYTVPKEGIENTFVWKISPNGTRSWLSHLNGTFTHSGREIDLLPNRPKTFILTGNFKKKIEVGFHDSDITTLTTINSVGTETYMTFVTCESNRFNLDTSFCDTIVAPSGNFYITTSGTYFDTLFNHNGGDSLIEIHASSFPLFDFTRVSDSFMVSPKQGLYQWLNCDSNYSIIKGETAHFIKPQSTKRVALELRNQQGCIDTSDCLLIWPLNISNPNHFTLEVFPNPSNGKYTISSDVPILEYSITDLVGKKIPSSAKQINEIDISSQISGYYLIQIHTESGIYHQKVFKR